MFDCHKIKLIIWDLDDTFWQGTLSEGEIIQNEAHNQLIKELTSRGIVNSICSKNDNEPVKEKLTKMQLWDYFVFPSINWEAKGERIKRIIADMKLRSENVLFLDDNWLNIKEAAFYNEGIMTAAPEEIEKLFAFVKETEATDMEHKRLQSYKLLEKKQVAQVKSGSNEAFLQESNIKVTIHRDCMKELDRIAEMILRTNQLNYTKNRMSKEKTEQLFLDEKIECGYVTAEDKYGAYGIVGFFAKKGMELIHFLFSCRTLGMGVEQYVYAELGYPALKVVGDVAVALEKDKKPEWINQERKLVREGRAALGDSGNAPKILFKGPCDLNSIFAFIEDSDNIESEFTYVSPKTGVSIEQISHTAMTVQSLTLSEKQKRLIVEEVPFGDADMYSDRIFTGGYDVVCLSILVDANLGVYRRKETGELVAYGEGYYPLTEQKNWQKYIQKEIYTAGCYWTEETLQDFCEKYEFIGIYDEEKIGKDLGFIRSHLAEQTLMIIMLGVEIPYEKNKLLAYDNRHNEHKKINAVIQNMVKQNKNVVCIDINQYIKGQESFYDQFNHFVPAVYYEMSKDIVKLVAEWTKLQLGEKSKMYMWTETVKEYMRKIKKRILNIRK